MPAVIEQRSFASGVDTYVRLTTGELVRPMRWGAAWNRIRIGLTCAITPSGTGNLNAVRFAVGVCSGRKSLCAQDNNSQFAGVQAWCVTGVALSPFGTVDLTYTANSGNPYFTHTNRSAMLTKVGAAVAGTAFVTSGGISHIVTAGTGSVVRKSPYIVDIQKGAGNFTYTLIASEMAAIDNVEWTYASLIDAMQQTSASPVTGLGTLTPTNASTHPTNENAGAFDMINVYWAKNMFPLEIYDLAVLRLA